MDKRVIGMSNKNFKKSAAFTIIELAVSIVIIGILAAIVVVSYPGIKKQMTISQIDAELRTAATQLSRDFSKNGKFPSTMQESGDGKGLSASSGTVFSYQYNATINSYCLAATNGSIVYYIDGINKKVATGACPTVPTFIKAWGGSGSEFGFYAIKNSEGDYVVTGQTDSSGAGSADMFLVKYRADGTLAWDKTWGGNNADHGSSLAQTNDGGYIVTGSTNSFGVSGTDMFLAKYTADGTLSWSKTWGGTGTDASYSVVVSSDGGYVVTGKTDSFSGSTDTFIVKYTADGTLSWSKTWGGSGNDISHTIISDKTGGYVVIGETTSYGAGGIDTFLAKFTADGALVWSKTWGGSGSDYGYSVAQTTDGGYIITGAATGLGAGIFRAFLAKFTVDGALSWSNSLGNGGMELGIFVAQNSDGSYITTGMTDSSGTGMSNDTFLAKYAIDGTLLWSKTWGESGNDSCFSVVNASDGGYVVANHSDSYGAGSEDMVLIKYNSDGNVNGCSSSMCKTFNPTVTPAYPSVSNHLVTLASPSPTVRTVSPADVSPPASDTVIVAPL